MKTQKTNVTLVLVTWVAGLCAAAQFAKISLIFPELQALYPGHGSAAGFLVTLISFVGMVLGLVAGIIVARFGVRIPLLAGLLLGGLISALQAMLPTFPLMLASRLAEGLSHLLIVVAAPTLIASAASDAHRPFVMTLWGSFFGVAFALIGLFGLPLVKAYGIPSLFLVHAMAMIAVAALLYLMLPRTERSPEQSALTWGDTLSRHVEAYTSPFISAAALGWLFYTLSYVSLLTVLPGLFREEDRAFAASVMPVAGIVLSLTLGSLLLRRFTAVQVTQLGFLLSGLSVIALWLFNDSVWIGIALFAVLGLVQGASFSAVPQLNPDPRHQALAYGGMAQMGNLGNLTGTVILLWLLGSFGITGLIGFGLVCYGGGFAIHTWLAARRARLANP